MRACTNVWLIIAKLGKFMLAGPLVLLAHYHGLCSPTCCGAIMSYTLTLLPGYAFVNNAPGIMGRPA